MNRTNETSGTDKKKRGTSRSKKAVCKGTAKLSKTANSTVFLHSDEIAQTLLMSTLKGNMNSARLLLSLAEEAGDGAGSGTARLKVSLATAWAAEPAWSEESSESAAETANGSREPES